MITYAHIFDINTYIFILRYNNDSRESYYTRNKFLGKNNVDIPLYCGGQGEKLVEETREWFDVSIKFYMRTIEQLHSFFSKKVISHLVVSYILPSFDIHSWNLVVHPLSPERKTFVGQSIAGMAIEERKKFI